MSENSIVVSELEELCEFYRKKYNKGGSFKPLKYYKHEDGRNEPVFFVGVPGLTVAVVVTLLVCCTVYLVTLPPNMWVWIVYLLASAVAVRFAMKADKVKQIRFMALSLSMHALTHLKKYDEESDKSKKQDYLRNAKSLLERADGWVQEPAISRQLELIEDAQKDAA